jgi:hypothetical protein
MASPRGLLLRDTLVPADYGARPSVDAHAPVLQRRDRLEAAERPDRLGPVVNELPGAVQALVHLALAAARPAARAVELALGAAGDWTDAGVFA